MEILSSLLPRSNAAPKLDQLPPEMLEFTLLKTTGALAPRLGRLAFPKRKNILTPAFIGNTSRGVVPHISQDNFSKTLDINGVYVALEDCNAPMKHDVAPR
jgi:queuine tRNA-ribosyltransferase